MGKTLKEEDLRLNIIVNGDPARKEIGRLTRDTKDLRIENERLRAEQKKLRAEGGDNKVRIAEITATIKKNSTTIQENEARIKQLRSEMKVTSMTTAELSQRHAELRNAMRNVVPGTSQYKRLQAELQTVNARMAQLRAETVETGGAMSRMASTVNRYIGSATAAVASFAVATSGLYKTVQTYSELDEAMSNARKTTDTTRDEIEALSERLARFDTRTAQNELLALARIGGKLGIAKEEIEGFTRAADIINVSLGEDLGDNVEDTIGQIGKLVNVFQLNKEFGIEQAMMKTASAVNDLGKASTANEANIVEFMRRVGGVGYSAKISLADIAGLGATLDDLGQTMEVAGTSMSQVITGMFRRTDAFAAAAKMSVEDFRKLMDEDMNEALIRMAEGMGSDGGAMSKIVEALDSLKLDGTRATGVLTALAQNTDKLREQQQVANEAFEEGTSCMAEFNVMNNTAEAVSEKLKKQITEEAAALGKALIPAYHESLSVQASLMKTARILIEWIIKNKGAIIGLVSAYLTYKGALLTVNAAKRTYTATVAALRGMKLSYLLAVRAVTGATIAETGATKAATVATRLFSIALKASPLGWAAAAIGAAVGAFTYFKMRAGEATDAQHTFNEITKAAADIEDEHGVNLVGKAEKISQLMRIVEDETGSEERRTAAIRELQELMPDGIDLINEETIANGKAAEAVKAYTDQLILQATIKAALQKKEGLIEQAGKDRLTGDDKKVGWFKRAMLFNAAANSYGALDYDTAIAEAEEQNKKEYQENLDRQLADLDKIIADAQAELEAKRLIVPAPKTKNPDGDDDPSSGEPKTHSGKAGEPKSWTLASDESFLAAKQKLRRQYADGEIASEQTYQDRLLALEISSLEARLAANKESGAARAKIEIQLADKLIEQKKREQEQADKAEDLRIQNITDATERENAEYERRKKQYAGNSAALEQLEIAHNRNLTKIELQRATSALKQEEDEYKQSRQVMQDRHKAELQTASLTRSERALIKQRQINELKALDEEYLRSVLAKLRSLNSDGTMTFRNLKGVLRTIDLDTSLLSEEEKNDLIRRINETEGAIDAAADRVEEMGYSFSQNRGNNLFGFSQDDWNLFFENIRTGKFGAEELQIALSAAGQAANTAMDLYSGYDKMMTAKENAALKKFKKSQDERKRSLANRLDAGLMTQEQHDAEVERMDAEYDKRQEELEIQQAKRQKAMSITQATIATSLAVAKALPNLVLAGIAAAMGAAQVAMIASTPIAGAEAGGLLIERAQDGRKFKAQITPDARGYVNRPTVLVGENGMEYVIPNEAMQNPTARPIINTFEAVRKRGRLRDFNFAEILPALYAIPGQAAGGRLSPMAASDAASAAGVSNFTVAGNSNPELVRALYAAVVKLTARLDNPIRADVSLMGKSGLLEKQREYERMMNRGKLK